MAGVETAGIRASPGGRPHRAKREPGPLKLLTKIGQVVADRLVGHEYRRGTRIPSAASLAQEFDLAPVIVRKAIVQLQEEGLLVSQVGWGTYVAK